MTVSTVGGSNSEEYQIAFHIQLQPCAMQISVKRKPGTQRDLVKIYQTLETLAKFRICARALHLISFKNVIYRVIFWIFSSDQIIFVIFTKCFLMSVQVKLLSQWHRSSIFIVNLENISRLFLVFLLLTLSRQMPAGWCKLIKVVSKKLTHLTRRCHPTQLHFLLSENFLSSLE